LTFIQMKTQKVRTDPGSVGLIQMKSQKVRTDPGLVEKSKSQD
jgi:hypothetical protein